MHWKHSIVAVAVTVALPGCASLGKEAVDRADRGHDRVHEDVQAIEAQRSRSNERARKAVEQPEDSSNPYLNTERVPIRESLPDVFDRQITFHEPYPTPVGQVMGKLSQATGLRVGFEYDLVDVANGESEEDESEDSAGTDVSVVDLDRLAGDRMTGSEDLVSDVKMTLSHRGRVRDVLDAAANALEANWRYDRGSGRVVFYRYVTRTLRIAMTTGGMANDITLDTTNEGSVGGGAESNLRLTAESSIWSSLDESLETMVSSRGEYSVSESMGTVTVRDVPDVVDRVEEYVEKLNETFSRQVSVDVQVYRVEATEADFRGVNWTAILNQPNFNIDVSTPPSGSGDIEPGSAILSIPERAAGRSLERFVGSEGFLESLNRVGRASSVTSTTLQTINNQPAPLRVGQTIGFLESVSESDTANVGSQTTLTPGEIDVGLSMQILPHVQDNGRDVLMQVMMTLSTLDNLTEFASGDNQIQLPEVSSRDFVQRSWLQSGESLVLAGFEDVQANLSNRGLVDAERWGFGGSRDAENVKESLVIVITPTVESIRDRI